MHVRRETACDVADPVEGATGLRGVVVRDLPLEPASLPAFAAVSAAATPARAVAETAASLPGGRAVLKGGRRKKKKKKNADDVLALIEEHQQPPLAA